MAHMAQLCFANLPFQSLDLILGESHPIGDLCCHAVFRNNDDPALRKFFDLLKTSGVLAA
jgi:hypothetical protein